MQDLDLLKANNAPTWSLQNDLVLDTAKLYLLATCFMQLTQDRSGPNGSDNFSFAFAKELLQSTQAYATLLITRVSAIAIETQTTYSDHLEKSHPLPGSPKHMSRVVFFAATVL